MSKELYKIGLIGVGRMGKNYISTINKMEDIEITHLCTTKPENAKLVSNHVKITGNYQDLFYDKTIDGVIIATPPSTHMDIMRNCVNTALPFMVEKPMALSTKDCVLINEMVLKFNLGCMVDYTQLYNPAFIELQRLYKGRKIETIETKVCAFGPFRKDVSMLWDWAPHDIAMILSLLKDFPTKINASYEKDEEHDNSGKLTIELTFKNTKAKIFIDNTSDVKYRSLIAKAGFSTMTIFGGELYETRDDKISSFPLSKELPLKKAVEEFIAAIDTGEAVGVNTSIDVSRIIEKCEKILNK
jgi:predicted dehydrogenase